MGLGDKFNPIDAIGNIGTRSGETLHQFKPTKRVKYFQKYYLLITPKSHKVREIWGIGNYKNLQECKNNMNTLEVMLKNKYGTMDSQVISMEFIKYVHSGEREILLKCTDTGLRLQYRDKKLNKLYKQERGELESKDIDKSAL